MVFVWRLLYGRVRVLTASSVPRANRGTWRAIKPDSTKGKTMEILATYRQTTPKPWNNGPQTGYHRRIVLPSGKVVEAGAWPSPGPSVFSRTASERRIGEGQEVVLFRRPGRYRASATTLGIGALDSAGRPIECSVVEYEESPRVLEFFEVA